MDMRTFQEEIEKLRKLKRSHAPFFNWHDREMQEKGIGMDFFQKLEESSGEHLLDIENAEDPPDVKITTSKGRVIGVEITELVDQKAIEYDIKGDRRYCERVVSWNKENTIEFIESVIARKDSKCQHVKEKYETLVLLIFTDEPKLDSDLLEEYLRDYNWPRTIHIDEAYILTGYEPKYGTKCLIRLF